jgi:hypothetical protein
MKGTHTLMNIEIYLIYQLVASADLLFWYLLS